MKVSRERKRGGEALLQKWARRKREEGIRCKVLPQPRGSAHESLVVERKDAIRVKDER